MSGGFSTLVTTPLIRIPTVCRRMVADGHGRPPPRIYRMACWFTACDVIYCHVIPRTKPCSASLLRRGPSTGGAASNMTATYPRSSLPAYIAIRADSSPRSTMDDATDADAEALRSTYDHRDHDRVLVCAPWGVCLPLSSYDLNVRRRPIKLLQRPVARSAQVGIQDIPISVT